MSMHMGDGTSTVPAWFAALPLTDPRCSNDSCVAYATAHQASQAQISWASQFLYGHYLTWIYAGTICLFALPFIFHSYSDRKPHPGRPSLLNKAKALLRAFSYRRIYGPMGTYFGLPSFGVMSLILLLTITSTVMVFAQHPYYRPRRGYGSPPLAIRTGLMATALIPLIIALAGKVNIITMLTGIGHEKLNVFHRYVGWIMFALSTVHTIPFFWQLQHEGGFAYVKRKFYAPGALEYNGVPAYALCFFLVTFSFPFARRAFYETFVFSHIASAITFFGLCFWHFGNELDSWWYLWASLAIWLIQILGRTFWKTSFFKVSGDWLVGLMAVAHKISSDMVKLEVTVPAHWTWRPGQHVFLRFPDLNLLDNHPFTIASIPQATHSATCGEKECTCTNTMMFLVRAHTGSTKKLISHLNIMPDPQLSTIIDGPYGTVSRQYENCAEDVILVAGGNGITACLPWLQHLSQAVRKENCVTKRVRLIWMVRKHDHVEWVAKELQKALAEAPVGVISVDVYVTDEHAEETALASATISIHNEVKGGVTTGVDSFDEHGGVEFHFEGRPNLRRLVPDLMGEERSAVIGCGPEGLKIDLSNAVAELQNRVLKGQAVEISLQTEAFDW